VIAVGTVVLDTPTPHLGAMVAFVVLPAGSLVTRYLVVRRMRMLRRQGVALRRILAVGTGFGVTNLVDLLSAGTEHELVVVGACAEGTGPVVEDVPVIARLPDGRVDAAQPTDDDAVQRVLAAVDEVRADTVCVTGCSQFTGARLRTLSWALAERRVDLMAVPGLIEVATHRIQFARAGAMTLLHVHPVSVTGLRGALKNVTDRVVAGALLVLLLPLLLGIGAVVRLTSPGAVLFRHTRVGAGGRPFTMLKFRTMRDGAHAIRDELLDSNEHDGLMFKLRDDPRITPVGRVLRRLSVDELPQLVNVLCGQMSLVGPRPPLPDEVAAYNQVEGRRLLVKPGMTGLWQVSGRSNLSWEETLRLDLRYVDNWSLGLDARLLWRTGRAVIRGTGAY
jgi:exopolysaccharide biosynthesis polyprenyl glycosylphosphotransferase